MSTYWDVYCVDCDDRHGFSNANRLVEEMRELIAHRETIASLDKLSSHSFRLEGYWGEAANAAWFAAHAGHRLAPRNEYGQIDGQCGEWVRCQCGSNRPCVLDDGHEGEHRAVKVT